MLSALARFTDALRREGLAVSPAETLDAVRAAETVGVEDRERFRAALRATLAKTRTDQMRFDRVFASHFAPPARGGRGRKGAPRGAGVGGERDTGVGDAGKATRPLRARPSSTPPREVRRLERGKAPIGSRQTRGSLEGAGAQRHVDAPERRRRIVLSRDRGPVTGATPHVREDPIRKLLASPMSTEDERRLAEQLPRILESLRRTRSRRFRRASVGRLWTRRIFRENLRHGGVPFVLPRHRRRSRPPRVVLLVDVSWSVARAAGLFLWMSSMLFGNSRRVQVIAFVDRPVDATEALRRWMRGLAPANEGDAFGSRENRRRPRPGEGIVRAGVPFSEWLADLRGLDLNAPSDYGRAFHALLRSSLRPTGTQTVLVVLGDGRTNRFEALPWTMEEIAQRCRSVLWLVPEPRGRWGTGDSALGAYAEHVDVLVEAADLPGLARGVAELVRSV